MTLLFTMKDDLVIAEIQDGDCWTCGRSFSQGVRVGSGGACHGCIISLGLDTFDVAVALPHVWGERVSRLQRASDIIRGLRSHATA